MLNTWKSSNVPFVIGYNGEKYSIKSLLYSFIKQKLLGEVDDDINFTYDDNTEISQSCVASWNNEMFVLGGLNQKRQVIV